MIALFALLALAVVLTALAFMYHRDPTFLTLGSREAVELTKVRAMARTLAPNVLKQRLANMAMGDFDESQRRGVDSEVRDQEEDGAALKELEDELHNL